MEALYTALGLAISAERHFCVLSSDPGSFENGLISLLGDCGINGGSIVLVDVSDEDLITPMLDGKTLKNAIIWRGVENLTQNEQRDRLLPLLLQLDNYDRNGAKRDNSRDVVLGRDHAYKVDFEPVKVEKPPFFCIIAVMGISEKRVKMHRAVKERFWFSQHVEAVGYKESGLKDKMGLGNLGSAKGPLGESESTEGPLGGNDSVEGPLGGSESTTGVSESHLSNTELSDYNSPSNPSETHVSLENTPQPAIQVTPASETQNAPETFKTLEPPSGYLKSGRNAQDAFQRARDTIPKIYLSPEIQGYIYSLVVHCRVHRLCSLAPLQTRLLTRAVASINLLAAAMVAWKETDPERWFVTTEHCKVAFRKVAYWLVDWEQLEMYTDPQTDLEKEYRKRMDFSILTGDWVGSELAYIDAYLKTYKGKRDVSSLVGFTNRLVDDALRAVQPPM